MRRASPQPTPAAGALTRRAFLRGAAAGAALLAFHARPSLAGRAASAGGAPLLVVVFLRGGADGLALVPAVGERALGRLRGALLARGALPFAAGSGVEFALHPALAPLAGHAREGRLAVVHAVGLPEPVRSHFDAQDRCERAGARPGAPAEGWLARALAAAPHPESAFRVVAASSARPRALLGDPRALAFEREHELALPARSPAAREALGRLFAAAEAGPRGALARAGREALEAVRALEARAHGPLPNEAAFPRGPLGQRLATTARLARADLGLVAAWVDAEGWDTHVNQGGDAGALARQAADLAAGLAALVDALESRADRLLVLAVTEFGRTAAPNGSGGTDHGRGGVALALGGAVAGGRVLGAWPGLGPEDLEEGRDLRVTTDLREVFAEAARFLGAAHLDDVLPGYAPAQLGLLARSAK